jgi:hypothetical protein
MAYPAMAYYVYLLASKKHGTLYLGVTNDIAAWKIPGGSISILASQTDTGVMDSGLALKEARPGMTNGLALNARSKQKPRHRCRGCIVELA